MTNDQAQVETTSEQGRRQFQTGMIMLVCAMLILPGIDAIAKGLSDSIAAGQVAWSRFFFQIIILHDMEYAINMTFFPRVNQGLGQPAAGITPYPNI